MLLLLLIFVFVVCLLNIIFVQKGNTNLFPTCFRNGSSFSWWFFVFEVRVFVNTTSYSHLKQFTAERMRTITPIRQYRSRVFLRTLEETKDSGKIRWMVNYDSFLRKRHKRPEVIQKQTLPQNVGPVCRGSFLESPETFLAHFGWYNFLCIFSTKGFRGKKLCSYF